MRCIRIVRSRIYYKKIGKGVCILISYYELRRKVNNLRKILTLHRYKIFNPLRESLYDRANL